MNIRARAKANAKEWIPEELKTAYVEGFISGFEYAQLLPNKCQYPVFDTNGDDIGCKNATTHNYNKISVCAYHFEMIQKEINQQAKENDP